MAKFRRPATRVQRVMAVLMIIALTALLLWTIPELIGVFSGNTEDTWSEWVWDQSFGVVLTIVIISILAAVLLIGSSWHFLEGYRRRRLIEQGRWSEKPTEPDDDEGRMV